MAIVSVAIILSFHLKNQPTEAEKRISLPVGLVFWVLSIACLVVGCENYVKTVTKYSRRTALVQSGFRTQIVSATRLSSSRLADLSFTPLLTWTHSGIYNCCVCHCRSVYSFPGYQCKEMITCPSRIKGPLNEIHSQKLVIIYGFYLYYEGILSRPTSVQLQEMCSSNARFSKMK